MKSWLDWICKVAIVCLFEQLSVIQGHGSELPPLFAPVLSFFQPFHDLSTVAREAPGQTVAVKGERYSRVEGSLNIGLSNTIVLKS
ncbi:hypothetical protein VZT92_022259 [Zoarces viviparus]|uniref:IPT/TIG domain-containing protein n=1 Tax=Zoarces viviparus TaxID=48416 RepID=A0AAW1ED10_ZOAVI